MWSSEVDGQVLTFRLMGLNNQNFIMRDEQTGTWWQQVTGEALVGPLAGKRLAPVMFDEVSFGIWRGEHPDTLVLEPVAEKQSEYAAENWDESLDMPVPEDIVPTGEWSPRQLIVGLFVDGRAKAYPIEALRAQSPVADQIGSVPVLIVVAADGRSIRAFERRLGGRVLDLYAEPGTDPPVLLDAQTGSRWNFLGRAVSGDLAESQLPRLLPLKDYWFDWKQHYPDTFVYTAR